jgi:hypothetical protein
MLELANSHIGLALLSGPSCLVTFQTRSGKGTRGREIAHPKPIIWGGIMGTWFWLNIPLALLFFACWSGIPLWLTLTRWKAELNAKHADLAAETGTAPVFAQPGPAVAHQTSGVPRADAADAHPFPVRLRLLP